MSETTIGWASVAPAGRRVRPSDLERNKGHRPNPFFHECFPVGGVRAFLEYVRNDDWLGVSCARRPARAPFRSGEEQGPPPQSLLSRMLPGRRRESLPRVCPKRRLAGRQLRPPAGACALQIWRGTRATAPIPSFTNASR